jgi:hypothetical protein
MEMPIHPAKCTMWCAISKQGIIGLISEEGTITNQWCLQQLQNEVILVIHRAGHVDTFFQQDGACQHTVNVILDILHDVFGIHVLLNQFAGFFGYGYILVGKSEGRDNS